MVIIAKTSEGFLIQASLREVESIFAAISKPITSGNPIQIGDKLPAFDYAATIEKLKSVKSSIDFRYMKEKTEELAKNVSNYVKAIESLTFEEK